MPQWLGQPELRAGTRVRETLRVESWAWEWGMDEVPVTDPPGEAIPLSKLDDTPRRYEKEDIQTTLVT